MYALYFLMVIVNKDKHFTYTAKLFEFGIKYYLLFYLAR